MYYFNRISVIDYNGREDVPHKLLLGTKFTTYKVLRVRFESIFIRLKRGMGCYDDLSSFKHKYEPLLQCYCPVLRNAGWHFTYVMNDVDMLKKLRSFADGSSNYPAPDFKRVR